VPAFLLSVERDVDVIARDKRTPKEVRAAFVAAYEQLEASGCKAASYRLSGAGELPRYCVVTLPRNWRLIIEFPGEDEVALLILAEHSRSSDPYALLAELAGLERHPSTPRTKMACCSDDGLPPLPAGAADVKVAADLFRRR
jgi:hypothetical protein